MKFEWETIFYNSADNHVLSAQRAKIFGGWLISNHLVDIKNHSYSQSMIFIADPNHEWKIDND